MHHLLFDLSYDLMWFYSDSPKSDESWGLFSLMLLWYFAQDISKILVVTEQVQVKNRTTGKLVGPLESSLISTSSRKPSLISLFLLWCPLWATAGSLTQQLLCLTFEGLYCSLTHGNDYFAHKHFHLANIYPELATKPSFHGSTAPAPSPSYKVWRQRWWATGARLGGQREVDGGRTLYQCVWTQSQELVPLDEFTQGSHAFSKEEVKCTAPGCSQLEPLFSLFCFGLFFP